MAGDATKHRKYTSLFIVPEKEISTAGETPTDNLLDVFRVITQMEKICTDQDGIGLAATQLGVPWNLCVILRDEKYEYYLNCSYVGIGEKQKSIEGCLSLRNSTGKLRRFEVDRFSTVSVKGKRLKISDSPSLILEDVDKVEHGLFAHVFQHELDHISRENMIDRIGVEIEII